MNSDAAANASSHWRVIKSLDYQDMYVLDVPKKLVDSQEFDTLCKWVVERSRDQMAYLIRVSSFAGDHQHPGAYLYFDNPEIGTAFVLTWM